MSAWNARSGSPHALLQGLWLGVAVPVLLLTFALALEDTGAVVATTVFFALPAAAFPGWVVDFFVSRQARTHPALAWLVAAVLILVATSWAVPYPDLGLFQDDADVLLLGALGWALVAERCAAHGWLGWRDRAAGVAVGLAVGMAFMASMASLAIAWILLLGMLALRLGRAARVSAALVAAVPSLALDALVDGVWPSRAAEAGAFLAYAALSFWAWRSRSPPLRAPAHPDLAGPV